jgi:hypothetical protein
MPVKQEKLRPPDKADQSPALRKVQFGSIAKKKPDNRASYPVIPDPQGQYAAIAARIIERAAQVEALAGALDLDKAELKTLATPFYFQNGQGKLEVPSSIVVPCPSGQVLITYQNRYGKLQSEARGVRRLNCNGVGAQSQRVAPVFFVERAGEHDNAAVLLRRIAQPFEDAESVQNGHLQIEQDQVGSWVFHSVAELRFALEISYGLFPVAYGSRDGNIGCFAKRPFQENQVILGVVHSQDSALINT